MKTNTKIGSQLTTDIKADKEFIERAEKYIKDRFNTDCKILGQYIDERFNKIYQVFLIEIGKEKLIFKKDEYQAYKIYNEIFKDKNLAVPKICEEFKIDDKNFILMEFINLPDMQIIKDDVSKLVGTKLAEIAKYFWNDKTYLDIGYSYEKYIERLEKRYNNFNQYPILQKAYIKYIEFVKTVPLTIVNGDLLPMNVLCDNKNVYFIDWEWVGMNVYTQDIGRLTVFSGENKIYECSEYEINTLLHSFYNGIKNCENAPQTYNEFNRHIQFTWFNQYMECLECYVRDNLEKDDDFENDYKSAVDLAKTLLE